MNSVNDRSRDIGPFVPGEDDDMLICRCEEITKGEIRKAVHDLDFSRQTDALEIAIPADSAIGYQFLRHSK